MRTVRAVTNFGLHPDGPFGPSRRWRDVDIYVTETKADPRGHANVESMNWPLGCHSVRRQRQQNEWNKFNSANLWFAILFIFSSEIQRELPQSKPSSDSAQNVAIKLNYECNIAHPSSFSRSLLLTHTHTHYAHARTNRHTMHTYAHTFNRTSTPSVVGPALYPHNDPSPPHTPPLIAYQVAPLPRPAAAPPFPQRCNYFRELPRGPEQLQKKGVCVCVCVCVRARACVRVRARARAR